jgi:RimJ/RimL family protein N-acetyltransferase
MSTMTSQQQGDEGEGRPGVPADAARLETMLTLRDGHHLRVRPIRADDTERLRAFHAQLSFESIVFRFFRAMPQLPLDQAEHFTHVDYKDRMALVATMGAGAAEEILGVVRYERTQPREAEIAFVVQDAWQGHGIATALLHLLAEYARAHDIDTFIAVTMGSNIRMLDVFHHCGFPYKSHYDGGDIVATLDISAPPVFPFGQAAHSG